MAVNGAHLDVKQGEIVAVIGPNGAGKTTLFNLITGILRPDGGKILFKGEEITGLSAHRICKKGMSRSFQVVNIFSRLTVFENVQIAILSRQGKTFNLFSPSKRLAIKETTEILASVGLADKTEPCERLPFPRGSEGAGDRHCPGRESGTPHPGRADCRHVPGRDQPLHRSDQAIVEPIRLNDPLLRARYGTGLCHCPSDHGHGSWSNPGSGTSRGGPMQPRGSGRLPG